jgi:DNA-binding MarR family transcriptional regulator
MYGIRYTQEMDPEALRAVRAWLRLDVAFGRFNGELRARYRVTGAQLAMLRIVAEREPVTLAALRSELALHPATLGQLIDRIVRMGWVARKADFADRRRRVLNLTAAGRRLLREAPLAGPVRLRTQPAEGERLRRLADAFDDAVVLFGMEEWTHESAGS